MLRWLLQLGLRREELCGVTLADLGEERGHRTVRVLGKGGKDPVLPLKRVQTLRLYPAKPSGVAS